MDFDPGLLTEAERQAVLSGEISISSLNGHAPKPTSLEELLGKPKDGKLLRPRNDMLTKAIEMVLPLRFNELTQRIENDGEPIDGEFLGTLYLQLAELHQLEITKNRAADAAMLVARRNSYHPVRDYLNGLITRLADEDWDNIAAKCFGKASADDNKHLQRQLVGLVARVLEPGCKLDTALVIHGPQGIGKSTLWSILGGRWFNDSLGDLRNLKDDVLQLHSAWIHEWGEIDSVVGKRESEAVKKFLSAKTDNVRKPYGRGVETLHRSCGVVGTTNRSDFIKDPTGNRRFPVISVTEIDTDWVKANRDAIWGSALEAHQAGQQWHYDVEENARITEAAMAYSAEDPLRDKLESYFEDHPEIQSIATPVLVFAIDHEKVGDQEFARQVAIRITSLGWTKSKKRERGYLPNGVKHDNASIWLCPTSATAVPDRTAQQSPVGF